MGSPKGAPEQDNSQGSPNRASNPAEKHIVGASQAAFSLGLCQLIEFVLGRPGVNGGGRSLGSLL